MTLPPPAHAHRLVFFGTPEVAVTPLRALVDAGYDVALVVTRADKRRGRGGAVTPSPVKAVATELELPVTTDIEAAVAVGADLGVVVAFGRLVKPPVLASLPMVNLHFSLLPRWRGAAPVERAILAGDEVTGVCVMDVVDELDAGDVFATEEVAIGPDETADELRARLVEVGTRLLLDGLAHGFGPPQPQVGEATYAAKLDPAELRFDWSRPAVELARVVRVGGAVTMYRGKRLKVWRARAAVAGGRPAKPGTVAGSTVACGEGALELLEVQPEAKRRMSIDDWRRGYQVVDGEILGG